MKNKLNSFTAFLYEISKLIVCWTREEYSLKLLQNASQYTQDEDETCKLNYNFNKTTFSTSHGQNKTIKKQHPNFLCGVIVILLFLE